MSASDDEYLSCEQMKSIILGHLRVNSEYYQTFHNGNLLQDAKNFFRTGQFNSNVVDVIISCASMALNLNLFIYQKGINGKVQVIKHVTHPSSTPVHLKFTHNNALPAANHYEPITVRGKGSWESYFGQSETKPTLTSLPTPPCPQVSTSPNSCQEEALDLSQNSASTLKQSVSPQASCSTTERPDKWSMEGIHDFFFPKHLFANIEAEWVDILPGNVNGKCLYKIKTNRKDYWKVTSDLWHFNMQTSGKKIDGRRKTGHCQGNLFCPNTECTFMATNQSEEPNKTQWQQHKGSALKQCYSCGSYAQTTKCPARKYVELSFDDNIATVYHLGKHICQPKVNAARYNAMGKKTMANNPNCGPTAARRNEVIRNIDQFGVEAGYKVAEDTQTRNCAQAKRQDLAQQDPSPHSFEAVAIYRQGLIKKDPYLIYKINDSSFNDNPDYVFKSSREMGNLALQMDQCNTNSSPLMEEEAYFDGAHKRCMGFKTLALFVYHPAMRKILKLATMEVRAENTRHISLFWIFFNNMLSDIKGKPTHFNPKSIMVDEAGANFCGVKEAFGEEYCMEKVVSCQLHYKKDVHRHAAKITESYRKQFISTCFKMCSAATVAKYNEHKKMLDEFAEIFPNLKHWVNWWDVRKYHVFTPFRRFGYSNVTFAEAGHSAGRRQTQLLLLEACKDDTAAMIMQVSDMKNFFLQLGTSTGKGPTALQKAWMSRKAQVKLAQEWVEELNNEEALQQEQEEAVNPKLFVPSGNCKHRPSKRNSVEGKLQQPCKPPARKRKKEYIPGIPGKLEMIQNVLNDASVMEGDHLQIDNPCQECQAGDVSRFPRDVIQYSAKRNKPQVVLFLGLNISRCRGCLHKIDRKLYPAPTDLVFRMEALRKFKCPKTGTLKQQWSNVYFHLDVCCLQQVAENIQLKDIMIADDTLVLLSRPHMEHLKEIGLLKNITTSQ